MNKKKKLNFFTFGWMYGFIHGEGNLRSIFDFSDCPNYEDMIEKMFKRYLLIKKDSKKGVVLGL